MDSPFTKEEKTRYARQTILPLIGEAGQHRLRTSRVLLIGAGGLGSSPAVYLTAAGVGTVGLVDPDTVSLSNLHRQVLHFTGDIGKPKVISAKEKLRQLNPHVRIVTYQENFNASNAKSIASDYDLIIDGTDNLPARYLINDVSFFLKKPFVFGGVHQFEGQCCVFGAGGPCYRCFFRELPPRDEMPSCAEAGVVGIVPGIIGLMQANEAIKLLCAIGEPLLGRLLIFDALGGRWREVKIKKDPQCPLCGIHPSIHTLEEYIWRCPDKEQSMDIPEEISVRELKELRDRQPDLYLLDVREQDEWEISRIEGAHLIPMSCLEGNLQQIPKDKPVYCFCKVGGRSARVVQFLRSRGYPNAVNVIGGIQAWASEIDPAVGHY